MTAARVEPRVAWPRSVVPGEPFLVSVDLALVDTGGEPWPFEDEEIEFTCVLDGGRHFRVEAVHDASVVLHRFGGSYGPAEFVVVARATSGGRSLRLTPLTAHGVVMGSVEMPVQVGPEGTEAGTKGVELAPRARPDASVGTGTVRRRALCITVSESDSMSPLPGAHDAARRVASGLAALGYECELVENPSAQNLRYRIHSFRTNYDDQSALRVVYFTGHGARQRDDLELITAEGYGVNFGSLVDQMMFAEPASSATLFLLDTCHSGMALGQLPLRYGASRTYLVTSSTDDRPSYNHLFSHSLADVLEEAVAGRLAPGEPGSAVPLSTFVAGIDRHMRERDPDVSQTVASSLTIPRPPDPAFIPVLAPPEPVVSTSGTSSFDVLGVHGFLGLNKGPHVLIQEWLPAVRDGIRLAGSSADVSTVNLTMAYFADLVAARYAQGDGPPDRDEAAEEATPEETEAIEDWLTAAGIPNPPRRYSAIPTIRQATGALVRLFPGLTERAMIGNLRQLVRYLREDERRDAVGTRVHGIITQARPRAVLAHSLGSIVAFDSLWRKPYPEVELLVTMASPMGMRTVVDRIPPERRTRPPGVRRWLDIAGVSDLVTVPRGGVARQFEGVTHREIDTGSSNAHEATRYLTSSVVGGLLADLLHRSGS
ncbi:caspase family protein [Streptomyces europaeiscabiei]|uniref:caspase family protein n=1 Tax=Streptomyces europaeiscabiei TaxID=146819 RepID=UPI0038F800FC